MSQYWKFVKSRPFTWYSREGDRQLRKRPMSADLVLLSNRIQNSQQSSLRRFTTRVAVDCSWCCHSTQRSHIEVIGFDSARHSFKMERDVEDDSSTSFVPQNIGILLALIFLTYVLVRSIHTFQFLILRRERLHSTYQEDIYVHVVDHISFQRCFSPSWSAT